MLTPRQLFAIPAALLTLGCSDAPLSVSAEPSAALGAASLSAAALSGRWNWSKLEQLTFPAWVAEGIFGIHPEGPTTRARCESSGQLTLVQAGATFGGTAVQFAQQCVTSGGQLFQDAASFIPTAIIDGRVTGRSISFVVDGVVVDCPMHAVITQTTGGLAVSLRGGGRCIVPGHPQSEIPMDPPPGGTSKALEWTATRL